jgi:hypothetical protein
MPMPNQRMNSGPSAMRGMLLKAVRKGERMRFSQSLRSRTSAEAIPSTTDRTKEIAISISVVRRLGRRSPSPTSFQNASTMLVGEETKAGSANP